MSTLSKSPTRYKKLITELPKHKHVKDALLASGFPESTATKQQKRVLGAALKYQAEEILKPNATQGMTTAQLMTEIVGLSRSDVMNRLKFIATQDKDLHSALKVLSVLAREHGVSLDDTENRVVVPILNIVVDKPDNEPVLIPEGMAI